jgi:hypothetical protein
MQHAYEDVLCGSWLGCVTSLVTIVVYSFLFLHVSTLWFVIPQFMQYSLVFHIILCVFINVASLVFVVLKVHSLFLK